MDRREFLTSASAAALVGCTTGGRIGDAQTADIEYHVFSKMFQPPVTKSPEELCELMKKAGFDGIQWTVRKGGHVDPANVAADLPRLCRIAESFGLKNRSICTDITSDASGRPGLSDGAETALRVAADCGIGMFRPAYFFYDAKNESFARSLERIRRGFAGLARLAERTGVKATYQNHSPWWGPRVFGSVVWDLWECLHELDPADVGLEFDPMYAFFQTGGAWRHGFGLVAPWIAALDLKDFRYAPPRAPGRPFEIEMVAAGKGVVPWDEVRELVAAHAPRVPRILHFEWAFDKADPFADVRRELAFFQEKLP
jgi:sugar phosphate isomerase/epimerase